MPPADRALRRVDGNPPLDRLSNACLPGWDRLPARLRSGDIRPCFQGHVHGSISVPEGWTRSLASGRDLDDQLMRRSIDEWDQIGAVPLEEEGLVRSTVGLRIHRQRRAGGGGARAGVV